MEKLTLLEERVYALILENVRLREEYKQMSEDAVTHAAEMQILKDENAILKESLEQEQQVKADILQRVDALLEELDGEENN